MGGECRYPQRRRQPADAAGSLHPRPDGHDAEPSAGRVSGSDPTETAAREIRAAAARRAYFFNTHRLPPGKRGGHKKVISCFCRNGMASVMPFPLSSVHSAG